ncbi:hypothetical protein H6G04_19475 [Calothrix membranacea FACHB-236]|nr:hypothetical protein [Calothrix membranacea FACHB-236]
MHLRNLKNIRLLFTKFLPIAIGRNNAIAYNKIFDLSLPEITKKLLTAQLKMQIFFSQNTCDFGNGILAISCGLGTVTKIV